MTARPASLSRTAPPDPHRCPVCDAHVDAPWCEACGADLGGPAGQELWVVDQELYRLSRRRDQLVEIVGRPTVGSAPRIDVPAGVAATGVRQPPTSQIPWTPAPLRESRPSPQTSSVLLGLGVMLLVIAALVFAAVSWTRLGAVAQGALLVGLTVAAGAGTHAAARRRLTGTAEALGVLTVVMAPLVAQAVRVTLDLPDIGDRTWSNLGVWSWWPATMVVIGAAAVTFARLVGIRSTRYIGMVLVQLGPVIWVALSPLPPSVMAAVFALQAGIVAALSDVADDDRPTAHVWGVGSMVTWSIALMVALGEAVSIGDSVIDRAGAAAALTACALAAATAAWRWESRPTWADTATVAASAAAVFAIGRGVAGSVPEVAWWPVMGLVGAAGTVLADKARGIRSTSVRGVSWATTALASLPVLGNAYAVLAASTLVSEPWHAGTTSRVEVDALPGLDPAWASALAGIAALGVALIVNRPRLSSGQVRVLGAGVAVLIATMVPALAGAPLWLVLASTLAAALGLAATTPIVHARVASASSVALLLLGVMWAVASTSLLLVTGGVAMAIGAAIAMRGLEGQDTQLAVGGTGLTAVAIIAEAGLAATAFGADAGRAWAVAASAAVIVLAALPGEALEIWPDGILRRRHPSATPAPAAPPSAVTPTVWAPAPRTARAQAMGAATVVLVAAHAYSLFSILTENATSIVTSLSGALAIGSVALAGVAARVRRSSRGWWIWAVAAGSEALVLSWIRMFDADVDFWEAFTLPLAVLVAVAGWLAARNGQTAMPEVPSWRLEGPGLAMAVGPTVLLALHDPGVTRLVTGLVVGALLLAVGADRHRRAPFDVGVAAVVILGLHTLLPYAAEVPRWVSLGSVGALLILLGATFEQRRRDFRQVKDQYSALV